MDMPNLPVARVKGGHAGSAYGCGMLITQAVPTIRF